MSYDDWIKSTVEPNIKALFPGEAGDLIMMMVDTAHKKGQVEAYIACTEKIKSLNK